MLVIHLKNQLLSYATDLAVIKPSRHTPRNWRPFITIDHKEIILTLKACTVMFTLERTKRSRTFELHQLSVQHASSNLYNVAALGWASCSVLLYSSF